MGLELVSPVGLPMSVRIKLTGTCRVQYTRILTIPDDEVDNFIDVAEDHGGAVIEANLDVGMHGEPGLNTRVDMGSWDQLDFEVLE